MAGSFLIRRNRDVDPSVRDPEQVISRLGHFWDAHGISKQVLDPRGPMHDKRVDFIDSDIGNSQFAVGMEGGISTREAWAINDALDLRNLRNRGLSTDEDPYWDTRSRINLLRPVNVHKGTFNQTLSVRFPTELHTGGYGERFTVPVPESGSSSDFWNAHKEHMNYVKRLLDPKTIGVDERPSESSRYEEIKNEAQDILESEEGKESLKDFDRQRISQVISDNPNHVAVYFHRPSKTSAFGHFSEDRLDLSTGTWARLNRDEFFPS